MNTQIQSMQYSLNQDANLIKGQSFILSVTINTDNHTNINGESIFIKNNKYINSPSDIPLILSKDGKTAVAYCGMIVDRNIPQNEKITFEVHTSLSGFQPGYFQCIPKLIDETSLTLTVDNKYLDLPEKDINPLSKVTNCAENNTGTTYCTKVHTVIKDITGNILSGVPVLITELTADSLNKFDIYDATSNKIIYPQLVNGRSQLYINSDNAGNLIFYIYSKPALSAVLNLLSAINGVSAFQPATTPIYAISSTLQSPNYLWRPEIAGFWTGNLISDGSETFFTKVDKYDNAKPNDIIVFYINNKRTNHIVTINNPDKDLDSYSIELPYDIFEHGKSSTFSYIVILVGGSIEISYPNQLTYMGGVIYKPDPNIKREYNTCVVHTSLGIQSDNIMPEYSIINYDTIKKYPYNTNNKNTGLFIKIEGSNDPKEKGKVPVGANVTLNLYIESATGDFMKIYKENKMPTNFDNKTKEPYLVVNIPYEDLINIGPINNEGPGSIYLDYEFSINEEKHYGNIWSGYINTETY